MKKFFSTLVVSSLAFFIGCQGNPVTEPIQPLNKKTNITVEDTINLSCVLEDPTGCNSQLTGEVNYVHQVTPIQVQLYEVNLTLNMSAQLCSNNGLNEIYCPIESTTTDILYINEEGINILTKAYIIQNRIDILLMVQYLVTTEGVGIPNLWLEEID